MSMRIHQISAGTAPQESAIGEPPLKVGPDAPVVLLFQVEDLLDSVELLVTDDGIEDLYSNDILGGAFNLRTISLSASGFGSETRRIAPLRINAPAGVDRVPQNDAKVERVYAYLSANLLVTVFSGQKKTERFRDLLHLGLVEPALRLRVIPHTKRKSDVALGVFTGTPLFLFGAPYSLQDFGPFEARHRRAHCPQQPTRLRAEIYRSIGQVEDGLGINELLQQGIVGEVFGPHQARKLLCDNAMDVRRFHAANQIFDFRRAKHRGPGHVSKLDGAYDCEVVLHASSPICGSLGRNSSPIFRRLPFS